MRKFGVAAGLLLMCLAGCTTRVEPSTIQKMEDVDHLSAVLPEVNDIRRRAWSDQEWCRKISSTPVDPATTSCRLVSIEVESPLIDADGAVTALRAALKHSGVEVSWVDISNGSPTDLEVHFHLKAGDFDRWSYVFLPGYLLPETLPKELIPTAINGSWYFLWEDWN